MFNPVSAKDAPRNMKVKLRIKAIVKISRGSFDENIDCKGHRERTNPVASGRKVLSTYKRGIEPKIDHAEVHEIKLTQRNAEW